jgi:hypothetical protein
MFMNGMWTTKDEARKHKDALRDIAYATGISPNCVHFKLSHTQDDGHAADIVETMIQKSTEFNVELAQLARMFLRLITPDAIFGDLIDAVFNRNVGEVKDDQLDKHAARVRELALDKGHRAIAVTHSQGGLYANALWHRLSSNEQADTRLITIATPASNVADGGANTRLTRDGVANLFFAGASVAGIIPNTGLCDKETVEEANSWLCYGFETGYLHDQGAREKIVADITDVLPAPPQLAVVQGYIFRKFFDELAVAEGGSTVRLHDSATDTILVETVSDESGFYSMLAPVCESCTIVATKFIQNERIFFEGFVNGLQIVPGVTYTLDVTMLFVIVQN